MNIYPIDLLLADDDEDDRLLFKEALAELPILTNLTIVNDGEQLIQLLATLTGQVPAVLFLDLNMPRKNGFECLTEIRLNEKYKSVPVIIYSTSFDEEMINRLYKNGAQYYIRKPAEFSKLKDVIYEALILITQRVRIKPGNEKFILHS
ncbi:MAG: response regulator [Ferruginibacter sp.]|nr:response regulator [Ferruginibacter sp.]